MHILLMDGIRKDRRNRGGKRMRRYLGISLSKPGVSRLYIYIHHNCVYMQASLA